MKKTGIVATILLLVGMLLIPCSGASAATDGFYTLSEVQPDAVWDGTDASRTKAPTADYDYTYGDEASLTYTLPWSFKFYGQTYSQINVDTNGNIWFGATGSANSFNLANTGRGPVIAAWNDDLSSYYYGGVFVQHKTDNNSDRVVIEWQTETYTEEGFYRPNVFEVVLYPNGTARMNYKSFNVSVCKDFGSGVSSNNGLYFTSLSTSFGSACSLAGRSFQVTENSDPSVVIAPITSPSNNTTQTINGVLHGTTVTVSVDTSAVVGPVTYPTPTTWTCTISGLPEGTSNISATVTDDSGRHASVAAPVPIVIDTIPPVVRIKSPSGTVGKTPLLDYTVSDGTVTVYVDGAVVSKVSGSHLDALTNGHHKLRVEARDAATNLGFAESDFTVDAIPPTITIYSPVAGVATNRTPLLNYTISDGTAVVKVDGKVVATVSGSNLDPLADGSHAVRIEATDAYGNTAVGGVRFTVDASQTPPGPENSGTSSISASYHTVEVKKDGTLWAWGSNWAGETGNGTSLNDIPYPVQIGIDTDWVSAAAGEAHSVALKADGTLWGWGDNGAGQLGDPTIGNGSLTPQQIGSDANWTAVAAGPYHTLALKADGTLWAWGDNEYGQLGVSNVSWSPTPIQVNLETDWVAITGNAYNSFAIKSDGTLWAWGVNGYGQLGNPNYYKAQTPVPVDNGSRGWASISAGEYHTVATKTDGSLWAWGANWYGQLGTGTQYSTYVPTPVGDDKDWLSAVAGDYHTMALKTDGTLWAWGDNEYGAIGDETRQDRNSPVQIGRGGTWSAIAAGEWHSLAARTDGTLWSWGANWDGELGDGTNAYGFLPRKLQTDAVSINNGAGATDDQNVQLRFNVTDLVGVTQMQFSGDGSTWTTPEPFSYVKSWLLGDGYGAKAIYAKFGDSLGNWSGAFSSSIVLQATPVVTINSPSAEIMNRNNPVLSYAVSDGDVTVTVDGAQVWSNSGDSLGPLLDGSHFVMIEATNAAGTGSARVDFIVDTVAPSVTITSPVNGGIINASPQLTFSVSEGTVVVRLDGVIVQKNSGDILGPLSDGPHKVRVEATDLAGNVRSAEVDFTVDAIPPQTAAMPGTGTYSSSLNVTLACNDARSGCMRTYYCLGSGCIPTVQYDGAIQLTPPQVLRFFSIDNSGNVELVKQVNYWDIATAPNDNAPSLPTNFQAASVVIGQTDFTGNSSNQGGSPAGNTISGPYGNPLVLNSVLYVPDTQNNRVLGFNSVPLANNATADFVLGQQDLTSSSAGNAANEMSGPQTVKFADGKLFVTDFNNSRILVWNTLPTSAQTPADVVVGQPAFGSSGSATSQTGLSYPESMEVAGGKLIVADSGNNRVLIWNSIPTQNGTPADLVLGQGDFTHNAANDDNQVGAADAGPTNRTLNYPAGVWSDGTRLIVADGSNNRLLIWNTFPATNFQPADIVLGQGDFIHNTANDDDQDGTADVTPTARTLNFPYFIDSNGDQLYVADTGNSRVLMWNGIPTTNFKEADEVLGQADFIHGVANDGGTPNAQTLSYPDGVHINGNRLFVTDGCNRRYLIYDLAPQPVTTTSLPRGYVGIAYSQIAATGGTGPYNWSVASGSLPAGLTLNESTGVITGTPTTVGTSTFTVQVQDGNGFMATMSLTIVISPAPSPPALSVNPVVTPTNVNSQTITGTTDAGVTITVTVDTPGSVAGPVTFSSLSDWSCTLTGLSEGTNTVTVSAANGAPTTTVVTVQIEVNAVPRVATETLNAGAFGVAYSQTMQASGGTGSYTWTWSGVSDKVLPPGLTLSPTGVISGIPTAVGIYPVTFVVTDSTGATGSKDLVLNITGLAAQWQKSYALNIQSQGNGIVIDAAGDYYVVGSDFLTKYNSTGNVLWTKPEGGTGVTLDSGGNVYVSGTARVFEIEDIHFHLQLTKYDPLGNLLWSVVDSNRGGVSFGGSIVRDNSDNIYLAGPVGEYPSGILIVKYDVNGNSISTLRYDLGCLGYPNIAVDKENNLYASVQPWGNPASFLLKYDPAGNLVFNKDTTGWGGLLAVDNDNDVYVASSSQGDYLTTKLDPTGNILWNKTFDSGHYESPSAITLDREGNIIISGTSTINELTHNYLNIKYSPNGNVLWTSINYGGYCHSPFGIAVDPDNAIYVAGNFHDRWGANYGYEVIKYVPSDLLISASSMPPAATGAEYSVTLNSSGGSQPCAWSIASGSLPDGLILNGASGEISGTPTVEGDFFFTVRATDSRNVSVVQSFMISVYAPLVITTSSLPSQRINTSYSQTLAATGGLQPYTWSIASGELPTGLALNSSTGEISGTLAAAGQSNFTVQVTDANGSIATSTPFSFNIEEISIMTKSLPSGTLGVAYNLRFQAVVDARYGIAVWSITGGTLPAGLTLDATGLISGTPTVAGHFSITVQVTDTNHQSTSKNFDLFIADVAQQWVRFYDGGVSGDDYSKAIRHDSAGNIYVSGVSFNDTNYDVVTVKYDTAGEVIWTRSFDTGADEWMSAAVMDGNDNLYIMGSAWDSQQGTNAVFIVKYGSNGDLLWQHTDNGWNPLGIGLDAGNNLYVSENTSDGVNSVTRTVKYDSNGGEQWHWDYTWNPDHYFRGMTTDANGNIYLTGDTVTGELVTAKYDVGSATVAWTRTHAGDNQWSNGKIAVSGDGNIYVAGSERDPQTGYGHFLLLQYNAAGSEQWVGRYNQPEESGSVHAIATDVGGNIYLSGHSCRDDYSYCDILTVKYDSTGIVQWSKAYSSGIQYDYEEASGIAVDLSGNVYVTGSAHQDPNGSYDYITVKYQKVGQ
jgi:alpha-tubulin suppressor-like RCC1 family protein